MKTRFAALCFVFFLTASVAWAAKPPPVLAGVDVLESQEFVPLKGKQVGLITNHTGVTRGGRSTADLLASAPGVKLVALFSPEHGIRGREGHGEIIGDSLDPKLHLPVYSLYGAVKKPTPEMLNAVDVLVFDMQDVGARFYTYITTMGMAMEAAAERKIGFVVLDRPNPAGGVVIEGEVLDPSFRHFTAYYEIPARHGMTVGEIALWYKEAHHINVSLNVIPLKNWSREMLWADTGRDFIPPSPNIRTPTAALLYSGIGMFETMSVAVGRGTETPFELVGAPWIDGPALSSRMEALELPGIRFSPVTFTPTADVYASTACAGVRLKVTDPKLVRPVDIFVHLLCAMRDLGATDLQLQPRWDEVARVAGTRNLEKMFNDKKSAVEILQTFHKSAEAFAAARQPSLLY